MSPLLFSFLNKTHLSVSYLLKWIPVWIWILKFHSDHFRSCRIVRVHENSQILNGSHPFSVKLLHGVLDSVAMAFTTCTISIGIPINLGDANSWSSAGERTYGRFHNLALPYLFPLPPSLRRRSRQGATLAR